MKGKVLLFALTAAGLLTLAMCQKKHPQKNWCSVGLAGLAVLKQTARQIYCHILRKSILATTAVAAAQWACTKLVTK